MKRIQRPADMGYVSVDSARVATDPQPAPTAMEPYEALELLVFNIGSCDIDSIVQARLTLDKARGEQS